MNDEIKAKLAKVLEIAKRGGTEAEASVAMAKALEMLAKHNLSMSDVTTAAVEDEDMIHVRNDVDNRSPWQYEIYFGIGELYFCKPYHSPYRLGAGGTRHTSMVLVGRRSNVETAKEIAEYLIALCKDLVSRERNTDKVYRNSFRAGFATRIRQRCRDERAACMTKITGENRERGLVVVDPYAVRKRENDDFLKSKGIRLGNMSCSSAVRDGSGYSAGVAAGNAASLRSAPVGRIGR